MKSDSTRKLNGVDRRVEREAGPGLPLLGELRIRLRSVQLRDT
jgi:hypothetical protein